MGRVDLEAELAALRALDPKSDEGVGRFRAALARKTGLIVAAAADRVREAALPDIERLLVRAWDALLEDPIRRDPGCAGKIAVIRALEELRWHDADVFVAAARYIQLEPAWGKPVDTAGPVRRYALAALVRLRWEGTRALIADALVDPDPHVRSAAADAIAAWGEPMGAALLRFLLHRGDPDAGVLIDALAALIDLDRPDGLALARQWLADESADRREVAALALGQSRRPEAVALLVEALVRTEDSAERRALYVALGTLRIEAARAFLLDALAGADVIHALEALRPYRFEPGLLDEVRRRVPKRMLPAVDEALGD